MAKYDPDEFFSAERKQSVIDNLVKRVIEAEDELIKHEVMANTVVLNGRKYGFLMKPGYYQSICGLKVEFDNLPDEMDFAVQKRPQTNAERIRAADNERLAELLNRVETDGRCGYLRGKRRWFDWLQQEVDT